ncbi:hypothetical protein [Microbispora sp. NBRC 16548]|uniref:hypothetical protein n=1 Tax=Microbispora sp. NBRC 16548 TaxID=3030994 RepID=UPI00249FCFB2|nr:hypothetical protein [Microbispora sp. NBRC 16548]GLX03309.1 hypothetical protein Misp03_02360 [Microbispora sp. NBRC 16548]
MKDTDVSDAGRPDGRRSSRETLRLRAATRALRLHLDELPVVFHYDGAGDQFLAEAAFPFARQRYDCAESMIGAGFGGAVLGSLARSLFVDGLRWLWIGQAPKSRRICLLGSMLEERNRICLALERYDASCPILPRWFAPLVGVTDLTGSSKTWLQAPALPHETDLLNIFLTGDHPATAGSNDLLSAAQRMLNIAGLRGAVMILSHAGHGNLLGLQSCLTENGAVGHDLRPDHEALYMHMAAVGVTLTLFGVSAAVPESWPAEVEHEEFLRQTLRLTEEVVASATVVHGLGPSQATQPAGKASKIQSAPPALLRPQVILDHSEILPDVNKADRVIAAAEKYYDYVQSFAIDPWQAGEPVKLANILTYAGANSSLTAVMSTYDREGSAVIAVFAARMLLEEAARFHWMIDGKSEDEIKQRFQQFFEDYRARRKKVVGLFTGSGMASASKLLELPAHVEIKTPHEQISKGRKPLPSIEEMLLGLGSPFPEPGWLNIAYSLLSQVAHSTPIGNLHMTSYRDGTLRSNDITPEMLGLTLDAACLGSAYLISISELFLSQGDEDVRERGRELHRLAYDVHNEARMLHGLD